ncbi:ADP-ribosylglycohydrolase family protein [Amycolatopsis keratiniphila]|uniref:ADP-ribosylglycohydrolase n=1 Tax=Amycolatopsis keratiniphila subsp. keratiniphila TaxID=227715 RepID=A0A1W2LJD8_9PSEU|nr:ADP-ribosylglycohydrolase family protein [Amycolatopsis keratiniphila]OLZ59878.1 ADP-ribosylglycohydrolase [Amycolatopsis keratiniphila subsp. nogabecina]ONF62866.1 ADP-ribosylglycohydrolase [Amycolatopsis keratiniphila subsp. keratiniphila]SDU56047.1 ADP-ribosylglycohydrolase [Amycolatopsis keratiniphila]
MLVELAIGDAYGGAFEHAYPSFVAEHNNLTGYVPHHGQPGAPAGRYTDDTQMTIAIAEVLVSGLRWTPLLLAEQFVRAYHRDPHDGYAPRFHQLLSEVRDGEELLRRLRPQSDKSGAAMRAGPIGILPTVDDVLYHAKLQARITHDTPAGIAAAQAAALAVHYCHHRLGPLSEIARWIEGILPEDVGHGGWALPWSGKVGPQGWMSVRAALTVLTGGGGLARMLHSAVALTGDVDTVATIALAAASRSPEVAQDLPPALWRDLENGEFGRDHLAALDERLLHI